MKKRLLGILVVAAMMICAIPMTASAELKSGVEVGGVKLANDGTVYSSNELSGIITNDGTVKLEGNTLYLNDVSITSTENHTIKAWSDITNLTIVLKGTNTVNNDDDSCISGYNITLKGEGSLTLGGDCPDMYCNGTLTFDNAKVTLGYMDAYPYEKGGDIIPGIINFNGASVVSAKAEGYAIMAGNEIFFNLTEGGSVSALSDNIAAVIVNSYDTITLGTNNVIKTPENGKIAEDEYGNEFIANADGTMATAVQVVYVASETKPAGANTGDSNNIALFGIMGILALCGAGFVYKRREN